ncbi:unnamed protein product [Heterobilharzia americana]|nr:unnamed protein product [Heterobilharzia americana]CAH8487325.1 unnamed protein product [Heterobilharzia americana]
MFQNGLLSVYPIQSNPIQSSPSPLSSSAYLLGDGFLIDWLPDQTSLLFILSGLLISSSVSSVGEICWCTSVVCWKCFSSGGESLNHHIEALTDLTYISVENPDVLRSLF